MHLASVYIGPCDEAIARDAVQRLLNELKSQHPGLDISHHVGLTYNKSPVLRYAPNGVLVSTLENGERSNQVLTALDPQKKTLVYSFHKEDVINLLLGKKKDGSLDEEEVIDPEWIPYNEENANREALASILSVDINNLLPPLWYETEVGDARPKPRTIRVPRVPVVVQIPMDAATSESRSLAADKDRGTNTFHTRFTTRSSFSMAEEADKLKVRVRNAFTYPIVPEEASMMPPNYIQKHKGEVLQHLASYNGGRAVEYSEEKNEYGETSILVVTFLTERAALLAFNLKGRGINVVDYRPPKVKRDYTAKTTDRRYNSSASSSASCRPRGRW